MFVTSGSMRPVFPYKVWFASVFFRESFMGSHQAPDKPLFTTITDS